MSCLTRQVVVSDKPGCGGWQYAQHHGIATEPFPITAAGGPDASAAAQALRATLRNTHTVDYVVLAGFLKVRGAPCHAGPSWPGRAAG